MSRHRQVKNYVNRREWDYDDYDDYDYYEEEEEEYNPYSYYNRGDEQNQEAYYESDNGTHQITLDELQANKEETNPTPTNSNAQTQKQPQPSSATSTTSKKKIKETATTQQQKPKPKPQKQKPQQQKQKNKKQTKKSTSSASDDKETTAKKVTYKKSPLDEKALAGRVCKNYSIVVIGHVDAGKSTVIGHLLYKQGAIDERMHSKNVHEAQKIGKQSFAFAWMMDEHSSERERGVTINVAQKSLHTASKVITILDAPGHRDFIPNMITGATHADAALLVVDASPGEFETGFDSGGQTREHVLLARSLGISSLIVAVNKMDMINWEKTRFDEVCERLLDFFAQCGFSKKKVQFVPISGFEGQNLTSPHASASWYSGPTLLEALDTLKANERDVHQPLRMTISDTFKRMGMSSLYVCGRILGGAVSVGDDICILPNNEIGRVKSIEVDDSDTKTWAYAGDTCTLAINGVDENNIRAGDLLCHPSQKPAMVNSLKCKIVMFDTRLPLLHGTQVTLHHQQDNMPATVHLLQQLNKKTMDVEKEQPRVLSRNMVGIVNVILEHPLCVEPVSVSKDLARVLLRQRGVTIAGGVVQEASLVEIEHERSAFSDDESSDHE